MELSRALRIVTGDVVAFVGAGGKTTAMFRLADELAAAGRRVIVTTTTLIYPPPPQYPLILDRDADRLAQRAAQQLRTRPLLVIAQDRVLDTEDQKLVGIEPETISAMREKTRADVILVEADGARGLPLKVPAEHEPVIPSTATLVVPVAGLNVVGQPLSAAAVHRSKRVAALTGLREGDAITPEAIAAVLAHAAGGLKGVPAGARVVALLNQTDDTRLQAGRDIAARLMGEPRMEAVCLAELRGGANGVREVHDRVAAIILAAGAGRRFGSLKPLAIWHGAPLLAHVVEAVRASQVNHAVLVTGYAEKRMGEFVRYRWPDLRIASNPDWAQGQSTSVRAGLRALSGGFGAALFVLADQPRLTPGVIDALLERRRQTLAPIVAPTYGGQRGNPVLFDRSLFAELMELTGDVGGRPLIAKYAAQVEWVTFAADAAPGDVDYSEDLSLL
jgi:molybdenum cofactor cytidylyltransferase